MGMLMDMRVGLMVLVRIKQGKGSNCGGNVTTFADLEIPYLPKTQYLLSNSLLP
jgi:hypothetical protein